MRYITVMTKRCSGICTSLELDSPTTTEMEYAFGCGQNGADRTGGVRSLNFMTPGHQRHIPNLPTGLAEGRE